MEPALNIQRLINLFLLLLKRANNLWFPFSLATQRLQGILIHLILPGKNIHSVNKNRNHLIWLDEPILGASSHTDDDDVNLLKETAFLT